MDFLMAAAVTWIGLSMILALPGHAEQIQASKGKPDMQSTLQNNVDHLIPPIDAAQPKSFETATFGLG